MLWKREASTNCSLTREAFPRLSMQCVLKISQTVFSTFLRLTILLLSLDLAAQNPPAPTPSVTLPGSQSPFLGSEPEGKASPAVLQLSFKEAIPRGLRNNLALLLSHDQPITALGGRVLGLRNLPPAF